MKILVTAANLIPPRGGAERSLFALAEKLAKDFTITILTPHKKDLVKKEKRYTLIAKKRPFYFYFLKSFFKINMQNFWWKKVLKNILKKGDYDLITTQGILAPSFYQLKTNAKKVIFVRGITFFNTDTPINPFDHKEDWYKYLSLMFRIQTPLVKYFQKKGLNILKEADLLISNSEFIRKVTKFYTGRNSIIIYPPIKKEDYKLKAHKRKYILFITPTIFKGVDMMYKIAKSLPHKNFIVMGKTNIANISIKNYHKKLLKLPNVKSIGYLQNTRQAYEKVSLLVSPVKWYEPFGRTPAEAMVNGIPSIVSNRGGLPEVVGNSGDIVKNRDDLKEWIRKIKKYDSKEYYLKKSELCEKRIKKFSSENQYKKLKKIIDSI